MLVRTRDGAADVRVDDVRTVEVCGDDVWTDDELTEPDGATCSEDGAEVLDAELADDEVFVAGTEEFAALDGAGVELDEPADDLLAAGLVVVPVRSPEPVDAEGTDVED